MAREDVPHLIFDDDNEIVDVEAWNLNIFYPKKMKTWTYHWEISSKYQTIISNDVEVARTVKEIFWRIPLA